MKKRNILKIIFVSVIICTAGIIFCCNLSDNSSSVIFLEEESAVEEAWTEAADITESSDDLLSEESYVCVYVCGAVSISGVYYLPEGSRLYEAIELAGGLNSDAAENYLNLAEKITDGQQIYVPSQDETEGTDQSCLQLGGTAQNEQDALININTAGTEELMTLSGIGSAKAAAIIEYREKYGLFNSIEDIKNVSGIKDSIFEKIKDHIRV